MTTTRRRKILLLLFLTVLLLGCLLAAWAADVGWRAWSLVQMRGQLQSVLAGGMEGVSPTELALSVSNASDHLSALRRDLRPLFGPLGMLGWLPGPVGRLAPQVEPLLEYAAELGEAAAALGRGLGPVWTRPSRAAPGALSQNIFLALLDGKPEFANASLALGRAARQRERIKPEALPAALRSDFLKLDGQFQTLRDGVYFLQVLPEMMGTSRPHAYLVMAQNRDELRATGGFITALGLVTVNRGEITQFEIGDSYRADNLSKTYPVPPEPLRRYMLAESWLPRDANWSPDYPTTARQIQALMLNSTGVATDGVLAFNQVALQSLLATLGPLNLPEYSEPIDQSNVEAYMRQAWAPAPKEEMDLDWWVKRKAFTQVLGKALLERLLATRDPATLLKLARRTVEDVQAGHILVFVNRPDVETILTNNGLDGAIHPGQGDYLMLVDSNIGFNKVDPAITRALEYLVDLTNAAAPSARVWVRYQHTLQEKVDCIHQPLYGRVYTDMQVRCYWDYWRVLAHPNSRLVEAQFLPVPGNQLLSGQPWNGPVTVGKEQNAASYEGLLVLPTGGLREFTLQLQLPREVIRATPAGIIYTLRIQKQPGLSGLPVRLQVRAPQAMALVSPPGWAKAANDIWLWQGTLTKTTDFELVFGAP